MNALRTISLTSALLTLVACGGGGGGGSAPVLPPSELSYGATIAFYLPGVSIPENTPTVQGTVDTFSVVPDLPAGLELDPLTGTVRGTPEGFSDAGTYTVTATGPKGSDSTTVEIAVVRPPRFAFAASPVDETITTYLIDPATGILRLQAVRMTPAGEQDPQVLVAHPSGEFVYSINGANNISHYQLDPTTGRLDARGPIATGTGPHSVAVAPDGGHLYVLARGEEAIYTYDIDPDGELTQVGTPVATGAGPVGLSLSPEGTFAYVAQETAGSVRTFAIDADSGLLTQAGDDVDFPGSGPVAVTVGPAGSWAFVALSAASEVVAAQVDPVSGVLAPTSGSAATADSPQAVSVHPTGRFVYVATGDAGEVEVWTFDADSQAMVRSTVMNLGSRPAHIQFDASGLFSLVSLPEDNVVAAYEVDLATGDFANALPAPARAGTSALTMSIGDEVVTRVPRRVYVVGEDSNDVQAWSVDAETGNLTALGASVPAGTRPRALAFDPHGRFAFAAGAGSRTLHTFLVEDDGSLTDSGLSLTLALGESPRGLGVDPTGRYLYVAVRNADVLRSYSIDGVTGALTFLDEAAAGTDLRALGVHPTGRFVYGSNYESSDLTAYRVEEGLFVDGPFTTIATSRPDGIRFSPRGDRAFVGGGSSDILIPYSIDPTRGALTPIPPGKGVGDRPTVIEIDPTDSWAYAAISDLPDGNGYIRFLLVHQETGGFVGGDAGAEIPAGLNPTDLRVDPSGRFLYVLNRTGSDMSVFTLNPALGTPMDERRVSTPTTPYSLHITHVLE